MGSDVRQGLAEEGRGAGGRGDDGGARRLCLLALPLVAMALSGWLGSRIPDVPQGGDAPAYLLAARYDPLLDNFDNPAHGWGYPALVRLVTAACGDEYVAARIVSALGAGLLVLASTALAFRLVPPAWAALASLIVAALPCVLLAGSAAMSDALFAGLAALAVWLVIGPAAAAAAAGAGVAAALSMLVRGNGIVLLVLLPAALLLVRRGARGGLRSVLLFAAGAGGVLLLAALLFAAHGAPVSRLLPAGAPEMAFATLDSSGTWNERQAYERQYPGYAALLAEHGVEVVHAAARTLWHVHEWWFLPTLSVLGLLTLPGLLLWLRRPTREQLAAALAFLGLQATYLWSGRFAQPRHVLAAAPFLVLVSLGGLTLLPRRVPLRPGGRPRLPVRAALALVVAAASVIAGGRLIAASPRFDPGATLVRDMAEAGRWLGARAKPGERVAASRLNIAYEARLWPVNFTDVFEAGYPGPDQLAARLAEHDCAWLAWIDGHSEIAFLPMAWLASAEDFPGGEVAHREGRLTLWRVRPPARGH